MTDKIKKTCDCDCLDKQATDPSRRDFIRKASTLTLIGGSAFILEACGGGGLQPHHHSIQIIWHLYSRGIQV